MHGLTYYYCNTISKTDKDFRWTYINQCMVKQKMQQITIKLSKRQLEGLKELAKEKGDQPISVVIREAVHVYLKKHNKV